MLHRGLYEQFINNALNNKLAEISEARKTVVPIDKAEASKEFLLAFKKNGTKRPIPLR